MQIEINFKEIIMDTHDFPENNFLKLQSDYIMKTIIYCLLILSLSYPVSLMSQNPNTDYDSDLAQSLGADDYGMKSYILVILKTGSNTTEDKDFIKQCFRGHLDNITRLVEEGIMIVAGPLGKNDKTYRGIFILNLKSISEAEEILQTDPALKEKLLEAELYPWYGSAALPKYLEFSDRIWKSKP